MAAPTENTPKAAPQYTAAKRKLLRLCRYIGQRFFRAVRHQVRLLRQCGKRLCSTVRWIGKHLLRSLRIFAARNDISFQPLQQIYHKTKAAVGTAPIGRLAFSFRLVRQAFSHFFETSLRSIAHSPSYAAPLIAAAFFCLAVFATTRNTFALRVIYNGEEVGLIADESVFEKAQRQMLGRIVFEDYIQPEDALPEFKMALVPEKMLIDEDALTNKLIVSSGNDLTEGCGLYADDTFVGAVAQKDSLLMLLEQIKAPYRDAEDEGVVEFVKEIDARSGLYPVSSVVSVSEMYKKLQSEQEEERVYITVQGDAPITIAQKNGIPYSQLKALNPDIEKSLLIGQEILVQKSVPLLEVKTIRQEVTEVEIAFKVEYTQDDTKYDGYYSLARRGQKGIKQVTSEVTYIDGVQVDSVTLESVVIEEPVNEKVILGGKRPPSQLPSTPQSTGGNFIWPVAGGYVSCGLYGYPGHTGMDIAANTGTAVYASKAGTVTRAVYNNYGYGYHIIINHGGGQETLYGHNSKLYVKAGDYVTQGQLIAAVGRTGRATGPHSHFEIRINGRYMNPANYVGNYCPY